MMRWGENETYQFVKIYLSQNCLWNSNHESYKLKHERQKAYQTIIDEFMSCTGIKLNESEVKIKIKNLRSTYAQEITKIRTRSSPNSQYTPTIKWFMDWHRCFKRIPMKSDIDSVYDDHISESDNKPWVTDNLDHTNGEGNVDPLASHAQNYHFEPKCMPITQLKSRISGSYKKKRKKNKLLSSNTQCNRSFNRSDSTLALTDREDEFEIYGRYIASQLRQMDLEKALQLQLEIQSLIREARVADISG